MAAYARYLHTSALILVSALCLSSGASATDGYFTHGVGMKAKGSGGAQIANAQEALSIAANPAAAVELGNQTEVGLELFSPDRRAVFRGNGVGPDASFSGNGTKLFPIPEFGLVRQINDKSAWGVAIYGNGGMNTNYKSNPFARFGATGAAGVNLEQLYISPSYAYRLSDRQSIGVSLDLLVQTFFAKGITPFASASQDPTHFTNNSKDTVCRQRPWA